MAVVPPSSSPMTPTSSVSEGDGVDISVSDANGGNGLFAFIDNLLFPFLAFAGLFFLFRRAQVALKRVSGYSAVLWTSAAPNLSSKRFSTPVSPLLMSPAPTRPSGEEGEGERVEEKGEAEEREGREGEEITMGARLSEAEEEREEGDHDGWGRAREEITIGGGGGSGGCGVGVAAGAVVNWEVERDYR